MPKQYDAKAIELCRALYLKYGGNPDMIQREMRRAGYTAWSKQNLVRSDPEKNWVLKYGFDRSLKIHLEMLEVRRAETDGERQLRQLVQVRDKLHEKLVSQPSLDQPTAYLFRDMCREVTAMLSRLEAGTKDLTAFAAAWEMLLDILSRTRRDLCEALLDEQETVLAEVRSRYAATHPD